MSAYQGGNPQHAPEEQGQLLQNVQLGETRITLLGTAHISRSSAAQVEAELDSLAYQAVAIELCPSRYDALTRPDRLAELDLMQVIRQGKAAMVMAAGLSVCCMMTSAPCSISASAEASSGSMKPPDSPTATQLFTQNWRR